MNCKDLWEKLAKDNSRYYINSDKGKGITESEFTESGRKDYNRLIKEDNHIPLGGVILEIGCGTGRMTEFMVDDFEVVIGVDISKEMVKQGRKRLKEKLNIIFLENDGYTFPIEDNEIDVVFSYIVFQHMKNRKMVESNFKETYRVLKHKGIFKVRIRTDKVDLNRWWGGVEYTEQSIGKIIKKIGFDIIKTEPVKDYGLWLWLQKP